MKSTGFADLQYRRIPSSRMANVSRSPISPLSNDSFLATPASLSRLNTITPLFGAQGTSFPDSPIMQALFQLEIAGYEVRKALSELYETWKTRSAIHDFNFGQSFIAAFGGKTKAMKLKEKLLEEDKKEYEKYVGRIKELSTQYNALREKLGKVADYILQLARLQSQLQGEGGADSWSMESYLKSNGYTNQGNLKSLFTKLGDIKYKPNLPNPEYFYPKQIFTHDQVRFGLVSMGTRSAAHASERNGYSGPTPPPEDPFDTFLRKCHLDNSILPLDWQHSFPTLKLSSKPPVLKSADALKLDDYEFILHTDAIKDFPDVMEARNFIYQKLLQVPGMAQKIQSMKSQ